jgi:hypothetical protein
MRVPRYLLWTALGSGVLAVAAGLAGLPRLAGGAAAVLFILFLVLPWMREERP